MKFINGITLLISILLGIGLTSCAQAAPATPTLDLRQAAAAQATIIVQQAEATAMIMQAQTRASALMAPVGLTPTLTPAIPETTPSDIYETSAPRPVSTLATMPVSTSGEVSPAGEVEIVKVSLASETSLIFVQFRAPHEISHSWFPGNVSVVNEATGKVYNEVPVLPIIGPLIAKPNEDYQLGYVMLTNGPPPNLILGDVITVILGTFKKEHVIVQQ